MTNIDTRCYLLQSKLKFCLVMRNRLKKYFPPTNGFRLRPNAIVFSENNIGIWNNSSSSNPSDKLILHICRLF